MLLLQVGVNLTNSQINIFVYLQIQLDYMSHYAFSFYIHKHQLAPIQWHSEELIVLLLQ